MTFRAESGYVLLSLLVLLLSVGGGLMSLSAGARLQPDSATFLSAHDQRALVDARQSLLSYSVLYPYMYGATGAGPAHLPCPDTDGLRQAEVDPQSGNRQRRDGPNPPCASLSGSQGLLPRHIVLPGHRYLIHSESWQRYEYRVAGNRVNNPLNRVVNLQQLHADAQQAAATITLPSSVDAGRAAQVTITSRTLALATDASVAAWVIQRVGQHRHAQCPLPSADTASAQNLHEGVTGEHCYFPGKGQSQCENDEALALILDAPAVFSGECLDDSLQSNTIEGVSALRHWFVRNQWYQSITLTYRDGCDTAQPLASSCELFLSREYHQSAIAPEKSMELYWAIPS